MTDIIRAEAAHEFLALVPALAGYRPRSSFVCIPFRGNRTLGVLRYDLPTAASEIDDFVSLVIGTACRLDGADAIVAIAYTEEAFEDGGGMPRRELLDAFTSVASDFGFLVRDALCVAADGWSSVFEAEAADSGHPLALIDESAERLTPRLQQASAIASRGAADGEFTGPGAFGQLPEADVATACSVAAALEVLALDPDSAEVERQFELLLKLSELTDPVELVEHLAATEPGRVEPKTIAWFGHLSEAPSCRDAMMLQFAFGAVIGEAALDQAEAWNSRRSATDAERCLEQESLSADAAAGYPIDFLTRLLLGETSVRPDPERTQRSLDAVRNAAAQLPYGRRSGALCISGWLAWALGRGTDASLLLERALDEAPEHSMSQLLLSYLGRGVLPEWAFAAPALDTTSVPLNDQRAERAASR